MNTQKSATAVLARISTDSKKAKKALLLCNTIEDYIHEECPKLKDRKALRKELNLILYLEFIIED